MYIKTKSEFNIEASEQLIVKGLFAPSVHCSYYGCFQFMKYKLKDCCGMTYDSIDNHVISSKKTNSPISEHMHVRRCIINQLQAQKRIKQAHLIKDNREFENMIKDIYKFRLESDYKDSEIDMSTADTALKYSKDVIRYINNNIK